jgi:protein-tyrosine-phosphatase
MGLLNNMLEEKQVEGDWQVESAGTWGLDGDPAASGSRAVMNNFGIDISDHRARRVDFDLLKSYNLVLTMELGHKEALCMEFPGFSERIYMLSEMVDEKKDIEDPYGGSYSGYEQAAEDIQFYLVNGFDTIIKLASNPS